MTTTYPDQRFVQVMLENNDGFEQTMTFTASKPGDDSKPEENGVYQHATEQMPDKAPDVLVLLKYLKENESTFLDWLEKSPKNSSLFATDPVKAVATALPNVPINL